MLVQKDLVMSVDSINNYALTMKVCVPYHYPSNLNSTILTEHKESITDFVKTTTDNHQHFKHHQQTLVVKQHLKLLLLLLLLGIMLQIKKESLTIWEVVVELA